MSFLGLKTQGTFLKSNFVQLILKVKNEALNVSCQKLVYIFMASFILTTACIKRKRV